MIARSTTQPACTLPRSCVDTRSAAPRATTHQHHTHQPRASSQPEQPPPYSTGNTTHRHGLSDIGRESRPSRETRPSAHAESIRLSCALAILACSRWLCEPCRSASAADPRPREGNRYRRFSRGACCSPCHRSTTSADCGHRSSACPSCGMVGAHTVLCRACSHVARC